MTNDRLAIVGLDGGTFRVLDVMISAGAMPRLADLRARGVSSVLRSTVPAYTPPGWASMSTGVNPGRHNTYGFLASTPQDPPRLAHSGHVAAPTMWRYLAALGKRIGVFNVPMSYPPVAVEGFMVSGGIAAGWQDAEMPNFASDPAVAAIVREAAGGHYPLDSEVSYELDWRTWSVADRFSAIQRTRRAALAAVLDTIEVDVVYAVFEGVDRLQHLHYQYLVEGSQWYARQEAPQVRDHAFEYFAEVDRAIGDIVDWTGSDGHVLVVSDHGAGPWEKTVNMNLLLEEWGYLRRPAAQKVAGSRPVAGPGQWLARRVLPRSVLNRVKAKLGASLDWDRTLAFSSQVAEQGVHVNEAEALPKGVVLSGDVPRIERELVDRLSAYVDPDDGAPIVDRALRRSEVVHGPFIGRAPHLFLICRDHRYELSDTVAATSPLTDRRDRPWGCHHADGVFVGAGPSFGPGTLPSGMDIVDVLPTAFHVFGLPIPEGLDGKVRLEAMHGEAAIRAPAFQGVSVEKNGAEYPFSEQAQQEIEESLRGLGYIE